MADHDISGGSTPWTWTPPGESAEAAVRPQADELLQILENARHAIEALPLGSNAHARRVLAAVNKLTEAKIEQHALRAAPGPS